MYPQYLKTFCMVLRFHFHNELIHIRLSVQGFCEWQICRITNIKKCMQKIRTQCAETLSVL